MRRKVMVVFLAAFFLVMALSSVHAAQTNTTDAQKVDHAYACMQNITTQKTCDKMTTQEKIFSVLGASQCAESLASSAKNGECWPNTRCDTKTTAQAIWALNKAGMNTTKQVNWLLSQKQVPTDMEWYLEIESNNATTCKISYQNQEYTTQILQDKKIVSPAGDCLSVSSNGYWLKINPACYSSQFDISCNQNFITTLLFKQKGTNITQVLDKTHSAPFNGDTLEKINSFCFGPAPGQCSYEGSLWSAFILQYLGKDISSYVPYLITEAPNNLQSFPSPILYMLTNYVDYRTNIIQRQINNQYWKFKDGQYYDTALAMLPFYQETNLQAKTDAINWLFGIQQQDGCFESNNIVDNGFLLESIWPRPYNGTTTFGNYSHTGGTASDCLQANHFCTSSIDCAQSNLLPSYTCDGVYKCCAVAPPPKNCASLGGTLCSNGQYCLGGSQKDTSDSSPEQVCCVAGTCTDTTTQTNNTTPTAQNQCVSNLGVCSTTKCSSGYSQNSLYSCGDAAQICCLPKGKKSNTGIFVLIAGIILVGLGILFRNKLKEVFGGMFHKGPKGPNGPRPMGPRPGMGPGNYPRRPAFPQPQRRIVPPSQRQAPGQARRATMPTRPINPAVRRKSPQELNDVLKKLKDMSK